MIPTVPEMGAVFFYDNWISIGPKWKIDLFGKGGSKMIAIAQFLVL